VQSLPDSSVSPPYMLISPIKNSYLIIVETVFEFALFKPYLLSQYKKAELLLSSITGCQLL